MNVKIDFFFIRSYFVLSVPLFLWFYLFIFIYFRKEILLIEQDAKYLYCEYTFYSLLSLSPTRLLTVIRNQKTHKNIWNNLSMKRKKISTVPKVIVCIKLLFKKDRCFSFFYSNETPLNHVKALSLEFINKLLSRQILVKFGVMIILHVYDELWGGYFWFIEDLIEFLIKSGQLSVLYRQKLFQFGIWLSFI